MRRTHRSIRLPAVAAAAMMAALPRPAAAEGPTSAKPAVNAPNLKLEAGGGVVDEGGVGGAAASFTVPLTHSFGLQADAAYFRAGDENAFGAALHAFFRNPESMLVGLTAHGAQISNASLFRLGAETEFYLDRFTIAPSAGFQRFLESNSAYGSLRLTYYPTDQASVGLSLSGHSGAFGVGVSGEHQLGASNSSFFVDAGVSDPGGGYALLGMRFWFGSKSPTLLARDRYDDPINLANFWNSPTGNSLLSQANNANTPLILPPTTPVSEESSEGGCFVAGARVLMADGSARRIEDVAIGEMVMGTDGAVNPVAALQRPRRGTHVLMSINRGPFLVNTRHAIATRGGWKAGHGAIAHAEYGERVPTAQLCVGDEIRTHDGWQAVDAIDMRASSKINVYNLLTAGDNTFHVGDGAGFMLVHG